jgi:hypothetical protein
MSKPSAANLEYNLPVVLMRQGKYFIAYTPALELSVQGRSKADVQKRFGEAVVLFFEDLHERGTMDEVLEDLGWVKRARSAWMPPQLIDSPSEIKVAVPAYA